MASATKKITENQVVQRIIGLLEDRGMKDKDLTDYLGLPTGSMAKWKYDGSMVYLKYIEQICECLKTTPNYLFLGMMESGGKEKLTTIENEVLSMFRNMDSGRQKCIRDAMKYFLKQEN